MGLWIGIWRNQQRSTMNRLAPNVVSSRQYSLLPDLWCSSKPTHRFRNAANFLMNFRPVVPSDLPPSVTPLRSLDASLRGFAWAERGFNSLSSRYASVSKRKRPFPSRDTSHSPRCSGSAGTESPSHCSHYPERTRSLQFNERVSEARRTSRLKNNDGAPPG
jgi:hypothetical protein